MLVRLIFGSDRIVHVRRALLFDVVSQQVRHRLAFGEAQHSLITFFERRQIADVQTPWINTVPGKEYGRLPVIDGDGDDAMPGDCEDVQRAIAKIDLAD